jgi:hypothetical protein
VNPVLIRLREPFRAARADLFLTLVRPGPGARLLDLGGSDGDLAGRITRRVPLDVTVADLGTAHRAAVLGRGFHYVELSPEPRLPFDDGAFDIVLCNSVIEHVTLPKERCGTDQRVPEPEWRRSAEAAQQAFARELSRVARGYFVQTPHRHFPLDPHTLLPFTQYLSHDHACRLVQWTDRLWVKTCHGTVDWQLLTPADLRRLFPDAAIHVERWAGLPKSIIAYRPAPALRRPHARPVTRP